MRTNRVPNPSLHTDEQEKNGHQQQTRQEVSSHSPNISTKYREKISMREKAKEQSHALLRRLKGIDERSSSSSSSKKEEEGIQKRERERERE